MACIRGLCASPSTVADRVHEFIQVFLDQGATPWLPLVPFLGRRWRFQEPGQSESGFSWGRRASNHVRSRRGEICTPHAWSLSRPLISDGPLLHQSIVWETEALRGDMVRAELGGHPKEPGKIPVAAQAHSKGLLSLCPSHSSTLVGALPPGPLSLVPPGLPGVPPT